MPNAGDELSSSEWIWISMVGSWRPMTDYTHGVYNQFVYVDPVSGVVIADLFKS